MPLTLAAINENRGKMIDFILGANWDNTLNAKLLGTEQYNLGL